MRWLVVSQINRGIRDALTNTSKEHRPSSNRPRCPRLHIALTSIEAVGRGMGPNPALLMTASDMNAGSKQNVTPHFPRQDWEKDTNDTNDSFLQHIDRIAM